VPLPPSLPFALPASAGTERKEDSAHHSAARRKEGAEINASLHALKECLRAIAKTEAHVAAAAAGGGEPPRAEHVPYRASTLTRVLSDSFTHPRALVAVLATVSPGCTASEHSLHTLQTVTAMCALDHLTTEEVGDVEAAPLFAPPPVPPKEWTHDALVDWLCALRNGRFRAQAASLPAELDGKRLCRMPATYFAQVLCAGNEPLGAALYNDLHAEMEHASRLKHEYVKLVRNARNAVKRG
jgi:kinesin family protein 2/24